MEVGLCNYCHQSACMFCLRCNDPYCSKKCQSVDWPQHKLFCFPMPALGSKSVKSGPVVETDLNSMKFRNLKLAAECDVSSKAGHQPLLENKENIPKMNDSAKTNGILSNNVPPVDKGTIPKTNATTKTNGILSNNVASVDKSSSDDKHEVRISMRPPYYRTDKVDYASIRKPGTLSQVMPKQITTQPIKQTIHQPQQEKVEPPKLEKVEPPKPENIEPPKPEKVEPPKPEKVEPPKPEKVEPPKPEKVEPPKSEKVEPPKSEKVEPQKLKVEPPPKKEIAQPSNQTEVPVESQISGPWMKPFPMEESVFVEVLVQYVGADGTAWVSLAKKEQENNDLLRRVNKIVSVASTPSPADVRVNSLFLVPFEEIYYRGMVLQPVTAKDTVSVRLVDFGNEFDLPIGQLKTALPSVTAVNAFAFPIKFKNRRNVEIGNSIKVKKESMDRDVVIVIGDGEAPTTPMITMKDIDVVPIPLGVNQNLVCLDFSNVGSGYVSLSIPDAKAMQFVDDMGVKMTKYCAEIKDEYCPQVTELCLAKFLDEGWYRAQTLKVIDGNQFEIMFIDYGNIITLNSSAIRKITDDFTHPCLMNVCYIKDFPKTPTKDDIQKAAIFFNDHTAFHAEKVEKDGDKYILHVKY